MFEVTTAFYGGYYMDVVGGAAASITWGSTAANYIGKAGLAVTVTAIATGNAGAVLLNVSAAAAVGRRGASVAPVLLQARVLGMRPIARALPVWQHCARAMCLTL